MPDYTSYTLSPHQVHYLGDGQIFISSYDEDADHYLLLTMRLADGPESGSFTGQVIVYSHLAEAASLMAREAFARHLDHHDPGSAPTSAAVQPTDRHLTASLVVLDPETERVLLVWHKAYDCLVFPGGHPESGETPDQAAIREVVEETGVLAKIVHFGQNIAPFMEGMNQISPPWQMFTIPAPAKPARPGKPAEPAHTHIDLLYIGIADSTLQDLTIAPDEVNSAVWARLDELADLRTRPDVNDLARFAWSLLRDEPYWTHP